MQSNNRQMIMQPTLQPRPVAMAPVRQSVTGVIGQPLINRLSSPINLARQVGSGQVVVGHVGMAGAARPRNAVPFPVPLRGNQIIQQRPHKVVSGMYPPTMFQLGTSPRIRPAGKVMQPVHSGALAQARLTAVQGMAFRQPLVSPMQPGAAGYTVRNIHPANDPSKKQLRPAMLQPKQIGLNYGPPRQLHVPAGQNKHQYMIAGGNITPVTPVTLVSPQILNPPGNLVRMPQPTGSVAMTPQFLAAQSTSSPASPLVPLSPGMFQVARAPGHPQFYSSPANRSSIQPAVFAFSTKSSMPVSTTSSPLATGSVTVSPPQGSVISSPTGSDHSSVIIMQSPSDSPAPDLPTDLSTRSTPEKAATGDTETCDAENEDPVDESLKSFQENYLNLRQKPAVSSTGDGTNMDHVDQPENFKENYLNLRQKHVVSSTGDGTSADSSVEAENPSKVMTLRGDADILSSGNNVATRPGDKFEFDTGDYTEAKTSTLLFHPDNKHMEIQHTTSTIGSTSSKHQPRTSSGVPRPLVLGKHQDIDQRLLDFILETFVPFSVIEHVSFKAYSNELENRYPVPGRKSLLTQIAKLYLQAKENLKQDLSETSSVAITHEAWTSINSDCYDTVTVHYVSQNWELKSAVLRTQLFPGSHTGENIANHLSETADLWNLSNVVAVTDNAVNERKAFQILGWQRVGCYGHRINLAVKAGLAVGEIARQTAKGRSVFKHFHTSAHSNEILMKKQSLLPESAQGHKLIKDVSTKWNSTFDMLARLMEQMTALHAVVLDPAVGNHDVELRSKLFNLEEQSLVETVIDILRPFQTATEMLSSEENPTQHLVLPVLKKLEMILDDKENDTAAVKKMKTAMRTSLESQPTDKDVALVAALLCPSTKSLAFVSPEECEQAKSLLRTEVLQTLAKRLVKKEANRLQALSELSDLPTSSNSDMEISVEPSARKKMKVHIGPDPTPQHVSCQSLDWLSDVICCDSESDKYVSTEVLAQQEFERYLLEPAVNEEPLSWWKKNQIFFPIISTVAKKYLSIPASSVASERIFSLAGNLMNKKRSELEPDNVDMMIFLNKNKSKYLSSSSH